MAARLAEIAQNLNPAINTYINAAWVEYLKTLPRPPVPICAPARAKPPLTSSKAPAAATTSRFRLTSDVRVLLGLSYMRLGRKTVSRRHASESTPCERGSQEALAEFAAHLADHPDDLTVRWLLGMYPEQVPAQWLVPSEVFASDCDNNGGRASFARELAGRRRPASQLAIVQQRQWDLCRRHRAGWPAHLPPDADGRLKGLRQRWLAGPFGWQRVLWRPDPPV